MQANKFSTGQLVATPGALDTCEKAGVIPFHYLLRHVRGEWGDLGPEDLRANDQALIHGGRLFSAYILPTAEKIWILTEADRSSTLILLPSEY